MQLINKNNLDLHSIPSKSRGLEVRQGLYSSVKKAPGWGAFNVSAISKCDYATPLNIDTPSSVKAYGAFRRILHLVVAICDRKLLNSIWDS